MSARRPQGREIRRRPHLFVQMQARKCLRESHERFELAHGDAIGCLVPADRVILSQSTVAFNQNALYGGRERAATVRSGIPRGCGGCSVHATDLALVGDCRGDGACVTNVALQLLFREGRAVLVSLIPIRSRSVFRSVIC